MDIYVIMIIFKNSLYVGDNEVAYISLIKIITIRLIAMSYELVLVQYKYKLGSIVTGTVNLLVDVTLLIDYLLDMWQIHLKHL